MAEIISLKNNYILSDCTLVTSCFNCNKFHNKALNIKEITEQIKITMELQCYMVIFCDEDMYPILLEERKKYNLLELTEFVVEDVMSIHSMQYLDKVNANREKYHPTRDERTNSHTHLITCNKFDFLLRAIETNKFGTSKMAWIDCFLYRPNNDRTCKISCHYDKSMIYYILNNVTDKFHIQVLNVNDKRFKEDQYKSEYYQHYRYVVCGCFLTFGLEIGKKIMQRLKDVFVRTTELGYGHGEEMFYLEVLDEFYDDIVKSYGDYQDILDNFIETKGNLNYIMDFVVNGYLNRGYHKEGYDCCVRILRDFNSQNAPINYSIYMRLLFNLYLCTFYYKNHEARPLVAHIYALCEKNHYLKKEFEGNKSFYEEQFKHSM